MSTKDTFKEIAGFLLLCICVVGCLGGFGYLLYFKQTFIAICELIAGGLGLAVAVRNFLNGINGK